MPFAARAHAWLYRRTSGRVLGRIAGQPVLLLETIGRRSGLTRTTPLQYVARGEDFVVVAANHGAKRPPDWYRNLGSGRGRVRVGKRVLDVAAHEASGDERTRLWRELTAVNRSLPKVEAKAMRPLPLLVLTPFPKETI